jgi:Leu/Phe-tRNA-protein transferase
VVRVSGYRSRDPFDFCGEDSKSVVYANNLHDPEALKQNIREAIYNIQQCELQQVSKNLFETIQACLTAEGRHFEHLYGEYNINYYI